MHNFAYHRPNSVADAAKAIAGGSDSKIIAGGQTLLPTLKMRLASPSDLVDLGGVADLKGIKAEGDGITIGATTTHAEVACSAAVKAAIPALAVLAGGIGDNQVRNRGTIGGSLAIFATYLFARQIRGQRIALLAAITLVIVVGHGDNNLLDGAWRTLNVLVGIAA